MDWYDVMKQARRQKVSDKSEDAAFPKYQSSAEAEAKLKIGRQSLIQLSSEHVIGVTRQTSANDSFCTK